MSENKEQKMMIQKSKIRAMVSTLSKELNIDADNIPDAMLGDLEKFSVEELLNIGDARLTYLQTINVDGRVTPEEVKLSVKALAAILKSIEGREKPKSRAVQAAQEH